MARTPDTRRGEAFRDWLRGLPRTTRRLVVTGIVLGWLALWYGVLFAADSAFGEDDPSWADPLPSMVGAMVGGGFVLWLQRHRMGSFGRVWEFDRAVRRRRLPDDADPTEWSSILDRGDRFQRGARRFALGATVIAGVLLMIGLAAVGFGWIAVLVAASICVVAIALVEFGGRRQSARIASLRDQLRGLPGRDPLTPGG